MTGRLEVVGRVSGRRRWSDAEKLEILAEAFRPGVRVCDVIARREVSSSLIYKWRKQLCNLYNLKVDPRGYFDALAAVDDSTNVLAVEKDYAAPGKPGYVVRYEDDQRVLSTMRWGFPTRKPRKRPAREGELPFLYDWWTNARNMQSNMWKPWLLRAEHRCLVPFTRFSEPKVAADRQGPGDTNWWFTVEDQSVPCFAGLWKVDADHDRVYAFCTTEPNPLVAPKHPKAMPVILLAEDQERWLTAPVEEALTMLTAYPSQLMGVV